MDRVTDPAAIAGMLDVHHHFLPHVYLKEMRIAKGMRVGKHQHDFNHMSILAKGSVIVRRSKGPIGHNETYTAPDYVVIEAGIDHEILALEDAVWFCAHATDETDPTKIDDALTSARKD